MYFPLYMSGVMMRRTLLIVVMLVVAVCLFWGMRYVGRQWGWPDSISTAVVGMIAMIVMFVERARLSRAGAIPRWSSPRQSITRPD